MNRLPSPSLVDRVEQLVQRFRLMEKFQEHATVVMACALQSEGYPVEVIKRPMVVQVNNCLTDDFECTCIEESLFLQMEGEVFDLRGNIGWRDILECAALRALDYERNIFLRQCEEEVDPLGVKAFFSEEPAVCSPRLLDRAKPSVVQLCKALSVASPRKNISIERSSWPNFSQAAERSPVLDLDNMGSGLTPVFEARENPLPPSALAFEIMSAMGKVDVLTREVAYQSEWLVIRKRRIAMEYGRPLRRICVDESQAWEGLHSEECVHDPAFDPSLVKLSSPSKINLLPKASETTVDLDPLRVVLSSVQLATTTPKVERQKNLRRM